MHTYNLWKKIWKYIAFNYSINIILVHLVYCIPQKTYISMGTQTVAKIPVVDFSNEDCLKPGTSSWLSISKNICHALEELGCFVAILPGKVSPELHNTFFGTLGELFDFPTEIKVRSSFEKPYPSGYITANAAHEGLAIGYATDPEDIRRFTHHFWPKGHESFRYNLVLYLT